MYPAYALGGSQIVAHLSQIDVSVNAPESGTIKELLVSEEDTVTVGQDLIKLELGGAHETKKEEAIEKPAAPAAADTPTASEPAQHKTPESPKASSDKATTPEPSPSKQAEPASTKSHAPGDVKPSVAGREERRVCTR